MSERRFPDGHTVHTRDGRGPGILLLNGCGLASAGWDDVVTALPGRRIIAVDRPGRCGTTCTELATLAGETRFLAELLRKTGQGPVIVVAHSMAAFQAEALARTCPGLVAGVVMVDPSVTARVRRASAVAVPLSRAARALLRLGPVRGAVAAAWRAGLRSQTALPAVIDTAGWREAWDDQQSLEAAATEWLSYSSQAAELQELRRQSPPARVGAVVLEAPPVADAAGAAALHASFSRTRLRRLPGCRHLVMVDSPGTIAQEVIDLLHSASDAAAPRV